ncbi:hypothetical protein LCGC14_2066760 [marine sediment metagenome]|uniref:ParB-like N-terminal domain-containing protein n=1 Tax=marine sediment metagenome TaxID=412755 RepID=A0A0F9EJK5_9ZZZZ
MLIELSKIHLDAKDRLRAKHQNIQKLASSIARRGLIQPIVLRPPHKSELPLPEGKDYVIEAGARRFIAMLFLQPMLESDPATLHLSLVPGEITAEIRHGDDELMSLEVEFHENEDRDNFDWKEKASYVWRIHDGNVARNPEWNVDDTSLLLEMGRSTTFQYLEFRDNPAVFADERVSGADTFRTAKKQFDIVKSLKKREMIVEFRKKRNADLKARQAEGGGATSVTDFELGTIYPSVDLDQVEMEVGGLAARIAQQGDCREWIKKWPDEAFDFLHWDPPYGGEQSGGAFTSFRKIDDSWAYAMKLISDMIPDLHRVLRPGHWLAIWCHPSNTQDVTRLLAGHVLDDVLPLRCYNCRKSWTSEKLQHYCPASGHSFWVNPYPNHWYKVNRKADGHEIKRFLVNAEEPFLFAAKMQ